MKYQAAIIGAGNIGAMLDEPQSPLVLTHAHGYESCEGFDFVGFVDSNRDRAEAAAKRWGGRAFESVEVLFGANPVDVISVCLPDELHYSALIDLARRPVKFIFLEKPAVKTPAEADEIRALYRGLPVRVQVNYTRRFVPEIRKLRDAIASGGFGKFLSGTGYYGKGLLHNGSHMVDLLRFLVGEVGQVEKVDELADFYGDDPSVSAALKMRAGGVFHLFHVDSRQFHIFELDLTFEKKRVRIHDLGTMVEEYSVGDHRLFQGYQTMNKITEYATQHSRAMSHAIANIHNNLERDEPLVCTLEESLETVMTCSRIKQGRDE